MKRVPPPSPHARRPDRCECEWQVLLVDSRSRAERRRRKRTRAFDAARAGGGPSAIARDRALARRVAGACRHAARTAPESSAPSRALSGAASMPSRRSCPLDRRHPCACRAAVSAAAPPARSPLGRLRAIGLRRERRGGSPSSDALGRAHHRPSLVSAGKASASAPRASSQRTRGRGCTPSSGRSVRAASAAK